MYIVYTYMYFLLAACLCYCAIAVIPRPRILYTPVFHFAPSIKQHHVVIVPGSHNAVYAFDFTPINQGGLKTQLGLIMGFSVPGEIRILRIPDVTGDVDIIKKWEHINGETQKIDDRKIRKIINKLHTWDKKMNMYTHNCQHFSAFMQGLLS